MSAMTACIRIGVPVGVAALAAWLPSCTRHEIDVKPIEVKPIHLTVDVNIRVDRQLNDFFAFEEKLEPAATRPATTTTTAPAATAPAASEPEPDVGVDGG